MSNETYVPNPLCKWVTVKDAPSILYPRWDVLDVGYRDAETDPPTDGSANIYVKVTDAVGNPLGGVRVAQAWPPYSPEEVAFKQTGKDGKTDFFMSGDSSFDPAKGQSGPYRVYVLFGDYPTPEVNGMGLPLKQHVNYDIVFRMDTGTSDPQTLEEMVKQVVDSVVWMPVNNTAALWKFAKERGLQDQQTDELGFAYGGEDYVAQVFNLGIVYARVGDWENIRVIRK